MKSSKSFFKILIILLLIAQNSFATKPIIGIGIVVKKNNCLPNPCKSTCHHGGAIIFTTGTSGGFSAQLEIGEYELSFPQDQLQTSINGLVKANYPKSGYQYDGTGVEMVLDNSQITVNSKATKRNMFAVDKLNSSITIIVPKGGATLSGKLVWNDSVLKKSEISCPDGFIMQNGECVPINNAGNQQARTERKTKGKIILSGNDGMRSVSGSTSENSKNSCGPSLTVSLNANGGSSSSAGVDNSFSFNPSLGIAIHWKNFGIGLDAGTFNTKPNFDFDTYAAPLQNLDFLTTANTKNDWTSTYFMLGPQYTIPLSPSQNKESGRHTPFHNKLTFTLALKGGLTINKAPEFSVTDKSTPPKTIASYTAPQDYKTNAFSLKPSIGFDYWMSENFALTANAQYLMQTGQKEFTTGYIDLTNVNLAPPISPDQFQKNIATAPKVMTNTKGPENYMSFGFGITYRFRKGGGDCDDSSDDIIGNTSERGIEKSQIKKNVTEIQENRVVGGIHQVTGLENESDKIVSQPDKGINENGLKKNDAEQLVVSSSNIKDMLVPKSFNITNSNVTTMMIKGMGETTAEGAPIVVGNTLSGNIKMVKGVSNAGILIEMIQKENGDYVAGYTDKNGDFLLGRASDSLHTASINGVEYGAIKIIGNTKDNTETNASRKGIPEKGLPKNETEYVLTDAEVKAIAETLVTMRKGWDGSINVKNTAEKGITENGLKKDDVDVFKITNNFMVKKNLLTVQPNRKENSQLGNSTTNTITKENNPNDNTGGPENQIYGYGGPVSYEFCIEFSDNQGNEIEYGSGVCFISSTLCDEDMGAITFNGSHIYIPKLSEKLNDLPINLLLRSATKNGISIKNKEFVINSDMALPAEIAQSLNCEKAFLTAGNYTYNENNAVEIPLKMVGRKGWDRTIKGYVPETGYGEIKPWLAKDGSIVYFEYEEDFLVEDQRMCDALGVKSFTIKKGKYKVNYDNSTTGGKFIWTLRKPINLKNNSNIETKIFHTTGGKHKHCSEPSNCCVATISSFSINDNLQPFYFKPIVINGNCSTIELQFIDVNTPRPSSE